MTISEKTQYYILHIVYITGSLVAFHHEVYTKIATRYCEHGFTSHVITHFAWKYYSSTVLCEQCKDIERFRVNEVSCQIFQPVENSTGTVLS